MIKPSHFLNILQANNINYYVGVPDSLLKDFCAYLFDNVSTERHIITANEGNAIAMAAGFYLATGTPALVYMQNSGLGNSVNPLLSLADKEVYGIPMILLIGWRGEPNVKDEPQHIKQGRVQESLLQALEIPFEIIDGKTDNIEDIVSNLTKTSVKDSCPVALVIRKGTFLDYKPTTLLGDCDSNMLREEALSIILSETKNDIIVSTTGKTSREVYELRAKQNQPHNDFLTVGSMGHSSSLALAISLAKPEKRVFCLDGDGAMLMHLGAMAIIGNKAPHNFYHILLNNSCHESVGGQPTASDTVKFASLSKSCGYKDYFQADNESSLRDSLREVKSIKGPVLIEVLIKKGSRKDLGRPTTTPQQNKQTFMEFIKQ